MLHSANIRRLLVILLAAMLLHSPLTAEEPVSSGRRFDETVAPLLARRCITCHNASKKEGGLDFTKETTATAGGDSGPVIAPGNLEESLLWERVSSDEMPPKEPLSAEEKEVLRRWIVDGAPWGEKTIDPFRWSTGARAGYDWWSLQPLRSPKIPVSNDGFKGDHPIDRFIARKLLEQGLALSPEADRRTLIRRLSFDLIGLPPTPEEVEAFVSDGEPKAYERLVDRLLASQQHGERWARHWLDVVRYGESQGFERDKLRPNSWPYRDWVIRSLNEDMPYDEFTRLQLAGDVLLPDNASAIAATGFLVAGPYDEVGQSQQSAAMRAVVRQDELEDIVGTVGQTFLGLTVNCARCHDHKFDPISQQEYYQLTAVLGGVRHGERSTVTQTMRLEIARLEKKRNALRERIAALEQPILADLQRERGLQPNERSQALPPRPIARWDFDGNLRDSIGQLHGEPHGPARTENGRLLLDGKTAYVATAPIPTPLLTKTLEAWVQLPNLSQRGGGVISLQSLDGAVFDAIVYGEREPNKWMAGSNGFVRTQNLKNAPKEGKANKRLTHVAIVYHADGRIECFRDGKPYGDAYLSNGPVSFEPGGAQVLFGLRHGTSPGGNRMLAGEIDRAQLYDRALTPEEVASAFALSPFVTPEDVTARLSPEQRSLREQWRKEAGSLSQEAKQLRDRKAYAVTPREPEVAHLLLRGNTARLGEVVAPNGILALRGIEPDFELAADAPEAERRRKLADWISSPKNPLFARVMANRTWHYHFGVGIVDTPNDFGFNGGRPSHPELLDFLAGALIEQGWSLKSLHRLIVTSATYRQQARRNEKAIALDGQNRLLWRRTPKRLEAETLRDTILAVAGELNDELGGPPYHDFKTSNFNSQFYEMIDPVGHAFNRRTIYRAWLRSGRNSLLDAFDCPDPSTTAPRRSVTTTPVQSLALLNNSFVLRMADQMASRIETRRGKADGLREKAASVFVLAYQRTPDEAEFDTIAKFTEQHGLAALCRVVFNSNEFLFVD